MSGNRSISELKFHNNATTIAEGEVCSVVSDASTLSIDFMGTGVFTSVVECKSSYESDWDEIMAVDAKTYDMSTTPNNFNTWIVDIVGVSYLRVRITSITGSVSAIGRLVG